jgi:hypothetical protein
MKLVRNYVLIMVLFSFMTVFAQQNTISYKFKAESLTQFGSITTTIEEGSFQEGVGYTLPEYTFESNFEPLQPAYDAIVGSVFRLESGAIDEDIHLNMTLGPFDNDQYAKVENEDLFVSLEIEVYTMPDSILVEGDYYFNEGTYAVLSVPKHDDFNEFVEDTLGMDPNNLLYAYITEEGFIVNNIETINNADSVKFRAEHFSKFGGGRGSISDIDGNNKQSGVPSEYKLNQNYPNPFNPSTTISYTIPEKEFVSLKVYNILGKEVAALVSKEQTAGSYEVQFNAENLPTGIYLYEFKAGAKTFTKKMMLIK